VIAVFYENILTKYYYKALLSCFAKITPERSSGPMVQSDKSRRYSDTFHTILKPIFLAENVSVLNNIFSEYDVSKKSLIINWIIFVFCNMLILKSIFLSLTLLILSSCCRNWLFFIEINTIICMNHIYNKKLYP